MTNNPTWIAVVALALFDGDGRILLQQRPARKHHGGAWEFPGGKVEPAENPRNALVREIAEELDIVLSPDELEPSYFAEEEGEQRVVLFLYISRQECGTVQALEGQEFGWFTIPDAQRLDLAPMDRALLARVSA